MRTLQDYTIGTRSVRIYTNEKVMPPSPYSLFIAERLPDLHGRTCADVGTGTGILAIVAKFNGASRVIATEINGDALDLARENAIANGVEQGMVFVRGEILDPVPGDEALDVIIGNPAALPMRTPPSGLSAYYAGQDGRSMVERIIDQASARLRPGGELWMVHTSLVDLPASERLLADKGFSFRIQDSKVLKFRPFYERDWIEELDGGTHRLFQVIDGDPYETINLLVATRREFQPVRVGQRDTATVDSGTGRHRDTPRN